MEGPGIDPRADPPCAFLRRQYRCKGSISGQGLSTQNHAYLRQTRQSALSALRLWCRSATQSMVSWRVAQAISGNFKMQIPRPISDLLSKNLYYNKIPQVIYLQSEKAVCWNGSRLTSIGFPLCQFTNFQ